MAMALVHTAVQNLVLAVADLVDVVDDQLSSEMDYSSEGCTCS